MSAREVTVFDEFVKPGYGVINNTIVEAMKLLAQTEGIFLDPVYTGKAMGGLIELVKRGYFKKEDVVVFIHTGGTAALFPYRQAVKPMVDLKEPPWTRPDWSDNLFL